MTATPGYRALTEGVAALVDSDRVVFELRGKRARHVVDGLLTNALDGLDEGTARYAFALTAKGRPVAEMRVLPEPGFEAGAGGGPESLWIDVPAAAAESFRDHLGRFVPPIYAEHRSLEVGRLSLVGPRAAELAAGIPAALDLSAGRTVEGLAELGCVSLGRGTDEWIGLLVRREDAEGPGIDVYLPDSFRGAAAEALEELAASRGGVPATSDDLEIVRIELGIPVYGREITTETLPQETGQGERAISFSKGCYTGQEVVARIHYRGKVNRHLRGLRASGTPLQAGDELSVDGKVVGAVTSAASSPRLGPIALGYVRREHEPGDLLVGPDASEVRIEALPFTIR